MIIIVKVTVLLKWCFLAHGDLLEVTTSVFLSCSLSHLSPSTDRPVTQATQLLGHVIKLLSVFVHVIEEREPEIKEKVIVHECL